MRQAIIWTIWLGCLVMAFLFVLVLNMPAPIERRPKPGPVNDIEAACTATDLDTMARARLGCH